MEEDNMPQAGLHAIVGTVTRKWMPQKEWLLLGLVLGNMFPDLDNLIVAYATLTKLPDPEGYHRTFTHSIFTVLAVMILFYLLGAVTRNGKWNNFSLGFGMGILMHVGIDLVLWFNGVELLWPLSTYELNFWSWFVTPVWLKILLDTGEFLMFGLYYLLLGSLAKNQSTDANHRQSLGMWAILQFALFILFTLVFFILGAGGLQHTVFGALYLISMIITMVITVRMRQTIETISS
jgi:LexA-binding, inner membrane-associated putative hydrolase